MLEGRIMISRGPCCKDPAARRNPKSGDEKHKNGRESNLRECHGASGSVEGSEGCQRGI